MQLSCSNFRLKLCQRPYSYENCQTNPIWKGLRRVRSKKLSSVTIIQKIFETNSSFHVKSTTGKGHHGKSTISVFQEIFTSADKIFILGGRLSTRQWFYEVWIFSWYVTCCRKRDQALWNTVSKRIELLFLCRCYVTSSFLQVNHSWTNFTEERKKRKKTRLTSFF